MKISALLFSLPLVLAATKSSGCGNTTLPAGLSAGSASVVYHLTSGGLDRTYRLYLPANYDASTASPLIVAYHGATKDSTDMEDISQFSNSTANPDHVVAYPEGYPNSKGTRYWEGASYSPAGVDDVAYTRDLLDFLEGSLCIDTGREFASGKSNGAGFAGLLSCDENASTWFAAFGIVSAANYPRTWENCTLGKDQVPLMEFHGVQDPTIPYDGGSGNGGDLPSIPDWFQSKAELNKGCNTTGPDVTTQVSGDEVYREEWYCGNGADKPLLVHYREEDMLHKWPCTEQAKVNGDLHCATAPILDFFKTWSP